MSALVQFLILAYAISWALWAPLWLPALGVNYIPVLPWNGHLGALGPMLAAIILTWRSKGSNGLRELGLQLLKPGPVRNWSVILALPTLGLILGYFRYPDPQLFEAGRLGGLFLVYLISAGIGEEVGWRGFALPRLQERYHALTSAVVLAIPWALWHLPLFLTEVAPAELESKRIIGWLVSLAAGSVVLTWLLNSARGGLLSVVVFHTLFNVVSRTPGAGWMGFLVLLTGITLLLIYKPKDLAFLPRVTV